jgi:hypothetical protein
MDGTSHRRHAYIVAWRESQGRLGTAPVHTNLAAANYSVNGAFWHAFEALEQEIVEALSIAIRADGQMAD